MHCQAHCANLLIGDVVKTFGEVEMKAKQVIHFFADCHYARTTYVAQKDLLNAGLQPGEPRQTMLSMPGATRWSSSVLCMEMVQSNRVCIETVLLTLRYAWFALFEFI